MSSIPLTQPASAERPGWRTVLRHRWPLRLMHWINLGCMLAMVGSGLQILNAHPALYWGEASHFDTPLASATAVTRGGELRGVLQVGNARFDSTGIAGVADNPQGKPVRAVAPSWCSTPSV